MSSNSIHVTPHPDGGWQAKKAGAERASYRTETQGEAIERSRPQSIREGLEQVIHNRQGRIREKNSYGNDPHPPKG